MSHKSKLKKIPCSPYLVDYLKDTLDLEKIKLKKLDGGKITKTDDDAIIANNDRKRGILKTHIFKSLANLVYFFEFLNLYPELIYKFDEDIADLLGLKGAGPRNPKGEGLIRLLIAILNEGSLDDFDIKFNFRRRMVKVMQYLVNQKAKSLIVTSKKDPLRYDDSQFRNMIFHDLDRAQVWMNYLDRLTGNEMKELNRTIDIDDLFPK